MDDSVKISLSRHASIDYESISLYLLEDLYQSQAEENFSKAVEQLFLNLAAFPKMGSLYDSEKYLSKPYRKLSFDRYTVFYVYHEEQQLIEVHRILSGLSDYTVIIKDAAPTYEA
ncbi:type II toxin-antitoxin system RelE/ParE family toxin [Listeria newyorkensis]|uniref:Type II toxin-antitoxin system RelE/ParE family toxin n=1 Tax=Listeria newyorkensis TaxID=1497681 RepID=A0A841YYC3_9LIST|nr:type II toxin-antitoxin system RelE/ParE family toxin [Listeria newyorkensis]MBC1458544.1 type II toxin-antitoxin system RelE/ParE family toxin [Listeria newyorkensis]